MNTSDIRWYSINTKLKVEEHEHIELDRALNIVTATWLAAVRSSKAERRRLQRPCLVLAAPSLSSLRFVSTALLRFPTSSRCQTQMLLGFAGCSRVSSSMK